ncbi:MAG: hypothetical protein Q8Q08_02380 [Candidatus Omnitrophota bacterium]|nr:hypothetical protein [Candidatus Omnitrophota bacterium]MDZ4242998.1 hypothetical protein [Candidatus Omnitrophota bacterium]
MPEKSFHRPDPGRQLRLFLWVLFPALFLYWAYLSFVTQMIVVHDSVNYEFLGRLIKDQGFPAYFQTGPHREPFYPILIALAMRLAEGMSLSYQTVLKVLQFIFLFLTQLLALRLMVRLNISPVLTGICLFYMGISPAFVNAALSLYSEIAAFPFAVLIVLAGGRVWTSLAEAPPRKAALGGAGLGAVFVFATLSKAIFQLVAALFIAGFAAVAVSAVLRKQPKTFRNILCFLAAFVLVYQGAVTCYKWANWTGNGTFTFTDRGAWALYGSTARRMEPLPGHRLLAAVAFAPGEEFCGKVANPEDCVFWSYRTSDDLGVNKLYELIGQGMSNQDINRTLLRFSIEKAVHNPAQYAILMAVEGLKMFFWESTGIGFVAYPDWLSAAHSLPLFKHGLRYLLAILTVLALGYGILVSWRGRRAVFCLSPPPEDRVLITGWITALILAHIISYSFFFILNRYVLPLAPLYIILIALFLQKCFRTTTRRSIPKRSAKAG